MVKYPIFVVDDTAVVTAFDTFEAAASCMEPVDVVNGVYTAYDSEGYRLEIGVTSKNYTADYTIMRSETQPTVPDELRGQILRSLEMVGDANHQAKAMADDELIEYARTIFLWQPSGCGLGFLGRLGALVKRLFQA